MDCAVETISMIKSCLSDIQGDWILLNYYLEVLTLMYFNYSFNDVLLNRINNLKKKLMIAKEHLWEYSQFQNLDTFGNLTQDELKELRKDIDTFSDIETKKYFMSSLDFCIDD